MSCVAHRWTNPNCSPVRHYPIFYFTMRGAPLDTAKLLGLYNNIRLNCPSHALFDRCEQPTQSAWRAKFSLPGSVVSGAFCAHSPPERIHPPALSIQVRAAHRALHLVRRRARHRAQSFGRDQVSISATLICYYTILLYSYNILL